MKYVKWFKHDNNARNDPKIRELVRVKGVIAKGIYWDLVEMLHEAGGSLPINKTIEIVAYENHLRKTDVVEYIIKDSELFIINEENGYFFSKRLSNEIQHMEDVSRQKSIAGKASGKARSNGKSNSYIDSNKVENKGEGANKEGKDAQQMMNICSTDDEQYKIKDNRDKIKDKRDNKDSKTKTKVSVPLALPFTSQKFKDAWNILCAQPKWKGKSSNALELSLKKLARYEEAFAVFLIEEAIEHNWQGVVFKDTDEQYEMWKQGKESSFPVSRPKSRIDQLQDDLDYIHNFFNGGQNDERERGTGIDDQ